MSMLPTFNLKKCTYEMDDEFLCLAQIDVTVGSVMCTRKQSCDVKLHLIICAWRYVWLYNLRNIIQFWWKWQWYLIKKLMTNVHVCHRLVWRKLELHLPPPRSVWLKRLSTDMESTGDPQPFWIKMTHGSKTVQKEESVFVLLHGFVAEPDSSEFYMMFILTLHFINSIQFHF